MQDIERAPTFLGLYWDRGRCELHYQRGARAYARLAQQLRRI